MLGPINKRIQVSVTWFISDISCFFSLLSFALFLQHLLFFQFHFEWIGLCGFRFVAKVFEFRIGSQWLYGSRFCEYRLITHEISKLIAKKIKNKIASNQSFLRPSFFRSYFFWKRKLFQFLHSIIRTLFDISSASTLLHPILM